jgi:hypothetical protein
MKKDAILVDVSRGGVSDCRALASALRAGRLAELRSTSSDRTCQSIIRSGDTSHDDLASLFQRLRGKGPLRCSATTCGAGRMVSHLRTWWTQGAGIDEDQGTMRDQGTQSSAASLYGPAMLCIRQPCLIGPFQSLLAYSWFTFFSFWSVPRKECLDISAL